MAKIDQLMATMVREKIFCLRLISDQESTFYVGEIEKSGQHFSVDEMENMLREIIPEQEFSALSTENYIGLEYESLHGQLCVSVSRKDSHLYALLRRSKGAHKVCQFCAEKIKADAIRCRYCKSDLLSTVELSAEESSQPHGIVTSLKLQASEEIDIPEIVNEKCDELYSEIKAFVSSYEEMSASLIQRKFEIGYPRAGRIVDQLERNGILAPADGPKPRKVLEAACSLIDSKSTKDNVFLDEDEIKAKVKQHIISRHERISASLSKNNLPVSEEKKLQSHDEIEPVAPISGITAVCCLLFFICFFGGIGYYMMTWKPAPPKPATSTVTASSPEQSPSASDLAAKEEQEKIQVFIKAKRFVNQKLKSPGSAEFPGYQEDYVEKINSRQWRVSAYVDAQNAYGTMVRTRWVATVTFNITEWYGDVTFLE